MSMTEPVETMAEPWDEFDASPSVVRTLPARCADRAEEFDCRTLAHRRRRHHDVPGALTTGAAMLVVSAASDWQSEVGREVTIQVRPAPGRNIDADVRAAV